MTIDKIMDYEDGQMSFGEVISFFSELIKSGLAWKLQGSYGRTAHSMITNGYLTNDGELTSLSKQIVED